LNGAYLLDSGVGVVVGDAGTIVKTTNAGMTWSPLPSGTTNALYDVYFFDGTQGVAVGEQGLIRRTTDGWSWLANRCSGVKDGLRSVSFSGVKRNRGGDSETSFIRPMQALRGIPGKLVFLGLLSLARTC